jgi:hypothetical protein
MQRLWIRRLSVLLMGGYAAFALIEAYLIAQD